MSERHEKPTDVEKLLAEVESTLGGRTVTPARRGGQEAVEPARRGLQARLRLAALSGATGAAVVWVVFAILPFLRATSGAVGAFLATFVVVLLLPRR